MKKWMMNMVPVLLVALLALTLISAGCSGGEEADQSEPSSASSAEYEDTSAAGEDQYAGEEEASGDGAASESDLSGPPRVYVVVEGDSLWSISQQILLYSPVGENATEEDILLFSKWLYERNLDVVGPSPDLIYPEQELRIW